MAKNKTKAEATMMPGATTDVAKAWMDIMTESTRFVMDRLQQDMETQKAMLNCKTPAEFLELQSKFYQSALEQYAKETTRLVNMMAGATETTVQGSASGHKRDYDDVPV